MFMRFSVYSCLVISFGLFLFLFTWSFIIKAQSENNSDAFAQVKKVVAKLDSLSSFRVNLRINGDGVGASSIGGVLSYDKGKSHFKLDDSRVVATNGIYMITFNPSHGVAAKQLVDAPTGGVGWLLSGYNYELISAREAMGTAQTEAMTIQKVRVLWSEDYFLQSLHLQAKTKETWSSFYLSNLRLVTSFSPSLFSFRPPTGSRTVENVLNKR